MGKRVGTIEQITRLLWLVARIEILKTIEALEDDFATKQAALLQNGKEVEN